ncbi:MAG: orotidine-5'-phosphate decarboxylase [Chloroflexi bacterium]|nr:orotidine-5'-phosphate decarboxylase [Chloroflexota bacterium]
MENFADRLISAIKKKGNPCIIGLDPRIDQMPSFITRNAVAIYGNTEAAIRGCIIGYNRLIIDNVYDLIPAVKPQSAFYEQYGIGGLLALRDTVEYAKSKNLVVIIDAKRNDIASTADAYANAFLGKTDVFGQKKAFLDADCITVSPFLGSDSIEPFVEACKQYGKGIFILVKTSNPGSHDLQEVKLANGDKLYIAVAEMIKPWVKQLQGELGYSSIGAVVGATYPAQANKIRKLLPESIFLVPGYGSQGGTAADIVPCFNKDGLGAVVSASRSITYESIPAECSRHDCENIIRKRTQQMIVEVTTSLSLKEPPKYT